VFRLKLDVNHFTEASNFNNDSDDDDNDDDDSDD
jgi:hypothetical protein